MKFITPGICLVLFILLLQHSTAQTTQWKLSGNKLDSTGKLGSTNNFSLDFITNNTRRMSLTKTGNLKIISDQASLQFPNPGASPKPMMYIYESGFINTSRMLFAYSPEFPKYGLQYTQGDRLDFMRDGINAVDIDLANMRLGVGIAQPKTVIHAVTGASGASPIANTTLTTENNSNNYISLLTPSALESGILFGNNLNAASGGIIYNNSGASNGLQFRTNGNATRMTLTNAGNLGIGTNVPKSNIHIFRGSAGGISPNVESPLTVEAGSNSFINVLTPEANVSGVLLGNNKNAADGGIVYGGVQHRMELRTNGNVTRMAIDQFGQVSIGTLDASSFQLKILHNPDFGGLGLENGFSHSNWGIFANEFGDLDLFHNGSFMGEFNKSTGAYSHLFGLAKTNIQPMPPMLEKISRLKPSSYEFKNSTDKTSHNGFIEEDMIKIFPDVVSHVVNKKSGVDAYTIDYNNISVIAIKGIQELVKINNDKDARIDSLQLYNNNLEKRIERLEAMMNVHAVKTESSLKTTLNKASLQQNMPNPFSTSTIIYYTLPQIFTSAKIVFSDVNGKVIETKNITGAGKGTLRIDASAFTQGLYNYSLIIDGNIIATKKMEHLK